MAEFTDEELEKASFSIEGMLKNKIITPSKSGYYHVLEQRTYTKDQLIEKIIDFHKIASNIMSYEKITEKN